MKNSKRIINILLAVLLIVLPFFTACSNKTQSPSKNNSETKVAAEKNSAQKKDAVASDTKVVKNSKGEDIEIPAQVTKVAPTIGAFNQLTCLLGAQEKVVAGSAKTDEFFQKVYPLANKDHRNMDNMEELVSSGAQVVYGPRISDEQAQNIEKAGIKYVKLDAYRNPEELKSTFKTIATILGDKELKQYEKFEKYYDEVLKSTAEKTKDLKKIRMLSLFDRKGTYSTIDKNDICEAYIEAAGGENVAAQFKGEQDSPIPVKNIDKEQIIAWNPEVIIINSQSAKNTLLNDPQLKVLDAVKNDRVYVVPKGTYLWSVRSAEGALMPLFLAKTLHPEEFKDLDLKKETVKFYREFSNYDLTEEELNMIFAGEK